MKTLKEHIVKSLSSSALAKQLDEKFLGFGKPKGPGPSLASYYVLGHAHPEGLDFSRGTYRINLSAKHIQRTHKKIVKMMGKRTLTNDKMSNFSNFLEDRGHTEKSAYDMGVNHNKLGAHQMDHDEMSSDIKQDLGQFSREIPPLANAYGRQARRTA